jgi:hypothetical protein
MGEPLTTAVAGAAVAGAGVAVAGAAGAGFAGYMAGVDVWAATGALLGALIYFTTTHELPIWQRVLFFIVSFVMGYMFAPGLVEAEFWGVRPFRFPGPAAFGASVLVVTVSLAAIKRRGPPADSAGQGGS